MNKGVIYEEMSEQAKAIKCYMPALKIIINLFNSDPENFGMIINALSTIGLLYYNQKRYLEQFLEIMRKKEARPEIAGQGGGRRRADARQGRQRSHAIPGPLNFSQYFRELL